MSPRNEKRPCEQAELVALHALQALSREEAQTLQAHIDRVPITRRIPMRESKSCICSRVRCGSTTASSAPVITTVPSRAPATNACGARPAAPAS